MIPSASEKPIYDLGNKCDNAKPLMRWNHTGIVVTHYEIKVNYLGRTILIARPDGKKVLVHIHMHPDFPLSLHVVVYFVIRDLWQSIGPDFKMSDNNQSNFWTLSSPHQNATFEVFPDAVIDVELANQSFTNIGNTWTSPKLRLGKLMTSMYNNDGTLLRKPLEGIRRLIVNGGAPEPTPAPFRGVGRGPSSVWTAPPTPPPPSHAIVAAIVADPMHNTSTMLQQAKLNLVQSEVENTKKALHDTKKALHEMTVKYQEAINALDAKGRELDATRDLLKKSQADLDQLRETLDEDAALNDMLKLLTAPSCA